MSTSVVELELEKIYKRIGRLQPDDVVKAATKSTHPLHDRFEWDDSKAGHRYRCQQAEALIRTVDVVMVKGDETIKVRSYIANRDLGSASPGYSSLQEVKDDPDALDHLERSMRRDFEALERRYSHLVSFRELITGKAQSYV